MPIAYKPNRILRAAFSALLFAAVLYADDFPTVCPAPNAGKLPLFPSATATGIDALCGLGGTPGPESSQNEAKNNFCALGAAGPITIQQMVNLQTSVQANKAISFGNSDKHPLSAQPGPMTNRAPLQALGEGKPVVLQGFVFAAAQEGEESVNCGKAVPNAAVDHDIHISIVDSASNTNECSGIVAEMIPHHRPTAWTPSALTAVAKAHLMVRVTGQLMFDSSHTPCVAGAAIAGDPKRASLWEVHPIYRFEVCPSGKCATTGWVDLANWPPKQ
jgi:hypothetical protein